MRWEPDEDEANVFLLLGDDAEGEPVELGRVEPGNPGFWRWSTRFSSNGGCGGVSGPRSAAQRMLLEELKATREMLLFNLEDE